jgi:FixJ family two-component response regulator
MMSAYAEVLMAVRALKSGAIDFLQKRAAERYMKRGAEIELEDSAAV